MEKKFMGYRVALGAFIIMFFHMGVLNTYGVFLPYISEGIGQPVETLALLVSLSTVVAFVVSLFLARVIKATSARVTLLIASLGVLAQYLLFGTQRHMAWFVIGAICSGLTMGFGCNACCADIIASWFIKKRAAVIGVVFGGAAFGGAIFQFLAGYLSDKIGYQGGYIVLGIVVTSVGLLTNLFLIRSPEKVGQKPLGWEEAQAQSETVAPEGLTAKEALKTPAFYMAFIAVVLCGPMVTGFQSYAPNFWRSLGMEATTSSYTVAAFSGIGALAVILLGFVANKAGNKIFLGISYVAYIVGMALVVITPSTNLNMGVVVASIAFLGFCYPCNTSVTATVTTDTFGRRDYTKINAYLMSALYIGKTLASPIISSVVGIRGSYSDAFAVCLTMGAVSFVLAEVAMIFSPVAKMRKASKNPS